MFLRLSSAPAKAAWLDPYRLKLVAPRLHHFMLVARLGSVRRAAQALNVAPSSVSRTLSQLEADFGAPLFERARQRLELTRAGAEIADLSGGKHGVAAIAVIESAARGLLPDALAECWKKYPAFEVGVNVEGAQQAVARVAEGECDLAPRQRHKRSGAAFGQTRRLAAHTKA